MAASLIEAYFDESGTDGESKYLIVAGYIFESGKAAEMGRRWTAALEPYGLDFFHMSDCAVDPGFRQFARLSKAERIAIATQCIELTKTHAIEGFAISVEHEFSDLIPRFGMFESSYTFACWQALMAVRYWIDRTGYTGNVAYFFEDGHATRPEANRVISQVLLHPVLGKAYRRVAHGFFDKRSHIPLQSADILAWQWLKRLKGLDFGPCKMRKDFESLLDLPHTVSHYPEARIKTFPEMNAALTQHAMETSRKYSRGYRYY